MIRKGDVQWWVLEAKKHPESAPDLIQELAKRLAELDAENEQLRDELVRRQSREPAAESEAVDTLQQRISQLQTLLESAASAEPLLLFFSHRLHAARLPLSKVRSLARQGQPALDRKLLPGLTGLVQAHPHEELLLLTDQGRGLTCLAADIPLLVEKEDWPALGLELASGERLAAVARAARPPHFWTVITRRGHVRPLLRIEIELAMGRGQPVFASPIERDRPVAVVNGDLDELLVITRWGKYVRFPQRAVPGEGTMALELEADDQVVGAVPLSSEKEVLIVTAAGYGMRRETAQLGGRSQPGGAVRPLMQGFDVLGGFSVKAEAQLLTLTTSGRLLLTAVSSIPLHHRASKGTELHDLSRDPAVAAVVLPGAP